MTGHHERPDIVHVLWTNQQPPCTEMPIAQYNHSPATGSRHCLSMQAEQPIIHRATPGQELSRVAPTGMGFSRRGAETPPTGLSSMVFRGTIL